VSRTLYRNIIRYAIKFHLRNLWSIHELVSCVQNAQFLRCKSSQ